MCVCGFQLDCLLCIVIDVSVIQYVSDHYWLIVNIPLTHLSVSLIQVNTSACYFVPLLSSSLPLLFFLLVPLATHVITDCLVHAYTLYHGIHPSLSWTHQSMDMLVMYALPCAFVPFDVHTSLHVCHYWSLCIIGYRGFSFLWFFPGGPPRGKGRSRGGGGGHKKWKDISFRSAIIV